MELVKKTALVSGKWEEGIPEGIGLFGSQEDSPWKKWPAKAELVLEAALPWCEALSEVGFT